MANTRHSPSHATPQIGLFGTTAPAQVHRLFFALFPDDAACARIAAFADELRPTLSSRCRWLEASRYHLTLHFLGDNDELRPDLVAAAGKAAARVATPAFEVTLDTFASFKGSRPPGVLRTSPDEMPVLDLWKNLRSELAREGFGARLDPEFTPHVTLFYGDSELPARAIAPIRWRAQEFRLIHSIIGQSRYSELGRWSLA